MSFLGDSTRIKKLIVKSYYLKELANFYDVSYYKMKNKMEPYKSQIGEPKDGYAYDAEQVELIFRLLRLPSNVQIVKV